LSWCLGPSQKPASMCQLLVPTGFKQCMFTEFLMHSGQAYCLFRCFHKCPFARAGCVWCCPSPFGFCYGFMLVMDTLCPLQAQNLHNMSLKCVRASPIFFEKKMEQAMGG
jgi:hypothetical protein